LKELDENGDRGSERGKELLIFDVIYSLSQQVSLFHSFFGEHHEKVVDDDELRVFT
jgi:hypothetical protein